MTKHIYKPGVKITCKSSLEYDGCYIPAATYKIAAISCTPSGRVDHVGISCKVAQENWGDLNGEVAPACGLWLSINVIRDHFKLNYVGSKVVIKDKFMFKRKDLKGKICKIVGSLPNSKIIFVELQEYIDGCSADGLGKAGHCILIPQEHLEKVN